MPCLKTAPPIELHGAIYNRMFKTIRIMLNRGCQVNEYYLHQTPLGAALTCGKTKSGDVRLVRILLSAKADIKRETKMCKSPFSVGSMGHHRYLAREYSNQRCRKLLKSVKEWTSWWITKEYLLISVTLTLNFCDNVISSAWYAEMTVIEFAKHISLPCIDFNVLYWTICCIWMPVGTN